MSAGFCRDCLAEHPAPTPTRCRACGSPRMIAHPELDTLSIAHVDCDAFYASVEKRDRPELRDKPLIIGGGQRGVVLTACYNARIFGVRSAMPMFKALKLCPHATIVRPDMAKYASVGRAVRAMMGALTPLVQPVSIDEPILYHLCEKVARRLAEGEVAAGGVVLKLKTSQFRLKTRSRTPMPPTQLAARLFDAGRGLLLSELDGTRYRLIGLGASDLRPAADADRADLVDTSLARQKATAKAIDAVRARFGGAALVRGITLGRDERRR